MTTQRPYTFLLRGGLDTETPAIGVKEGHAIAGYNYEPVAKGYRRFAGFERLDGRPKPSGASYWLIDFDQGTTAIAAGDVVTGATSGATGIALQITVTAGTWGGGDAEGVLALYNVTGVFQTAENLQVSASTRAVSASAATARGAGTDTEDAALLLAAREERRTAIGRPTGSGAIRGVVGYAGAAWCVRDNGDADAGVLHKATASGWAGQAFGSTLPFGTGSTAFSEGETVTGGTSGASAPIRRVVVTSGDWSTNDAAGYLVIGAVTGGPFQAEAITSAAGAANATAAQTAIALPAGGRYEFKAHSFKGGTTQRLYMANGVGRAHEWCATSGTLAPIHTGLAANLDKPTHVAEFRNHLFLFYADGTVLFSETGDPLHWTTTGGAGEFQFGDRITNVVSSSDVLLIFGATRISYLIGNDSGDFELRRLSQDSGALAWTAQTVDTPYYFDGGDVRRLTATEALGGWRMGGATPQAMSFYKAKADAGTVPVASFRRRRDDHYVVLFSDRTGVVVYLGRRTPEPMPYDLPFQATVAWSGDDLGAEAVLIGSNDGWVYELDKGNDYDGDTDTAMTALLVLGFVTPSSPFQKDRYHSARLGIVASGRATVSISCEFDYGEATEATSRQTDFGVTVGGGRWNVANWNEFQWSAPVAGQPVARIDGVGFNCSAALYHESTNEEPHTLEWLAFHTTPRRIVR